MWVILTHAEGSKGAAKSRGSSVIFRYRMACHFAQLVAHACYYEVCYKST